MRLHFPLVMIFVTILLLFGVSVLYRGSILREAFETQQQPPDLSQMLNKVQGLLDKVATPEVLAQMTSVMDKDPGELARLYAEKTKGGK